MQECFGVTSFILERDAFALEAVPLHLTAAVELKKKNELFRIAHKYALLTLPSPSHPHLLDTDSLDHQY